MKHFIKVEGGDTFEIEKDLEDYYFDSGRQSYVIPKAWKDVNREFLVYQLRIKKSRVIMEWMEETKEDIENERKFKKAIDDIFEQVIEEHEKKKAQKEKEREKKEKEKIRAKTLEDFLKEREMERVKDQIEKTPFPIHPFKPISPFPYNTPQPPYIIGTYRKGEGFVGTDKDKDQK